VDPVRGLSSFADPEPSWPDHDDQDVDFRPRLLNVLAKIGAYGDALDINENRLLSVPGGQPVRDATGGRG
jgi:hypothetical protein